MQVHADREIVVIGVQVGWANNDHGVLCGSGLSENGTPQINVERQTVLNRTGMYPRGCSNSSIEVTK
jgi:hypothetical protein